MTIMISRNLKPTEGPYKNKVVLTRSGTFDEILTLTFTTLNTLLCTRDLSLLGIYVLLVQICT